MSESLASRIHAANAVLLAGGNLEAIPDFFTQGHVTHLTEQDMDGGHKAIRGFVNALRSAFPDLQVEVQILVEGTDRVAWQRICRGTHKGKFMGMPPSGRRLVWRDMITSRFEGNLIAEEWGISDLLDRMVHK